MTIKHKKILRFDTNMLPVFFFAFVKHAWHYIPDLESKNFACVAYCSAMNATNYLIELYCCGQIISGVDFVLTFRPIIFCRDVNEAVSA